MSDKRDNEGSSNVSEINPQATSSDQGRRFEELVVFNLQKEGWKILGRHEKFDGMEIDITAEDPDGKYWLIECKGSYRGGIPGLRRADTVKKAVGVAWFLSCHPTRPSYMLITSHPPIAGSVGDQLCRRALEVGLFDELRVISMMTTWPPAPENEEMADDAA